MPDSHTNNPFSLLGLPETYEVDRAQIERAYRLRLSGVHPDTGGAAGDPADPADSAALNRARSILLSDEQRAIALLDLLGGPGAGDCKDLPDGFLMQVMLKRQEIEDAIESGGEDEREHWEQWGEQERRAYRLRVGTMFASLPDQPGERSLRELRVQLNAWRYIERLIEQLDPEYDPADAEFR